MNIDSLRPFLKQAMLSSNSDIQVPANHLFNGLPGAEDPDSETIDENIVEDPEKQKDISGENTEGMIMEPAFKELEEETKEEALKENNESKDNESISTFMSKESSYWDYLKARYGNNRR